MKSNGRRAAGNKRPELSRLETEVMNVIWDLGECSSAEVTATFTQKRPLAATTIRTVLANLRKKGYLEPIPTIERGFRLRATVDRDSVAKRTLKSLVTSLFGGSPRRAIAYLLKQEEINDGDLAEIRRMLDQQAKGRRP